MVEEHNELPYNIHHLKGGVQSTGSKIPQAQTYVALLPTLHSSSFTLATKVVYTR